MSPIPVAGLGTIDVSILHDGFSRMLASYNSETSGWLTCESGCCTMDQA
jgi:hypothetical protein